MKNKFDVIVVGAGIIGMATAHNLAESGCRVAVVERKYIGSGSTGRCIGGLRHQFSSPTAIRLMKESIQLFADMEKELNQPVEFHQGGYLLLAHNQELADVFKENIEIQRSEQVDVSLVSPDEISRIVPHLNLDGVVAGAYCPQDGQAFPFAVLKGYRRAISARRGEFFLHNPVTQFSKNKNFSLVLQDGTELESEKVLLSAGPWTAELARHFNLELPLYPDRHEAVITERMPRFFEPMIVDYRPDGCYFHQLLSGQIIGCYTPVPSVPGIREDVSFEFLPRVAFRMSRLMPPLKNASILRHWSGCYTNTPDGNPILDETNIENLYVASGMCGHGFMFGPAMGRHMAHFITEGKWAMDFSEFALTRDFSPGAENLK